MEFLYFVLLLLVSKLAAAVTFSPGDRQFAVPDTYSVGLFPGHSLDAHWEAIGVNISEVAEKFSTLYPLDPGRCYFFKSADKSAFEAVLRDPLVKFFHQDHYIPLDQFESSNGPSFQIDDQGRPIYDNETESSMDRDGRQLWNINTFWYDAMLTAGVELPLPIPDHNNDYFLMSRPTPGEGVNIYILDSGIMRNHQAFEGGIVGHYRVTNFKGLQDTDMSPYVDETMEDTAGHGTKVAALAIGAAYGTAPRANAINVKVGGKGATNQRIAQAVRDVTEEHIQNRKNLPASKFRGSVINMSFGVLADADAEDLLMALVDAHRAGIPIVAAAGNWGTDVERPRYSFVLCVGSVDRNYGKAKSSCYGKHVNIFAPGEDVVSASLQGPRAYASCSGTSFAAPLVAGILASFITYEGDTRPKEDAGWIYKTLLLNRISNAVKGLSFWDWATPRHLANTRLNNPQKDPEHPYRMIDPEALSSGNSCHIALTELWTCQAPEMNLFAQFVISDPMGWPIYDSLDVHAIGEPGVSINDQNPHVVRSASLSHDLVIIGKHESDYIQFYYGDLTWTSGTTSGNNRCELIEPDWDKSGPACPGGPIVSC